MISFPWRLFYSRATVERGAGDTGAERGLAQTTNPQTITEPQSTRRKISAAHPTSDCCHRRPSAGELSFASFLRTLSLISGFRERADGCASPKVGYGFACPVIHLYNRAHRPTKPVITLWPYLYSQQMIAFYPCAGKIGSTNQGEKNHGSHQGEKNHGSQR